MQLKPKQQRTLHPLLSTSHQMLLAVGDGKDKIPGKLYRLKRNNDVWDQEGASIPCVFGEKGWAMGMKEMEIETGLSLKKEGDQKTPLGIFTLGTAYGYAPNSEVDFTKMPYLSVNKNIKAVDDPKSRFYNQIINENLIENKDWDSAEDMKRDDDLYKWGIVINYNTSNVDPGAGSCIYLHLWRDEKSGTAGCTAMAEENFTDILEWLNPDERPVIVQMPQTSQEKILSTLGLELKS